jgi:predicted AAA+ superfamily ATPase
LALEIAGQQKSLYLDLEDENDRVKLSDPSKYLEDHQDELIVLDEVHRVPEIFHSTLLDDAGT